MAGEAWSSPVSDQGEKAQAIDSRRMGRQADAKAQSMHACID